MNKKYILILLILFVIIVGSFFIFNMKKDKVILTNKIKVVTSFYPLYFFTSEIAGDKATVSSITPNGIEPHDYEPTVRNITKIEDSNLLILNGTGLEAWGENIKQNINPKNTTVLTVGDGITNQNVTENGQNIIDPHIWLSPPLAKKIADKIAQALMQIDPINSNYYENNVNSLKSRLDDLDTQYKQGLSNCTGKDIITSHAAFGYLTTTYGLNQIPIAGLSPEEEPSPKQMADISKFAKSNNVKYIFFENLISPKLSETISEEIGAQTLVLNPIEGLTEDEIKSGKDYFSEMRNNLINLKTALQCK